MVASAANSAASLLGAPAGALPLAGLSGVLGVLARVPLLSLGLGFFPGAAWSNVLSAPALCCEPPAPSAPELGVPLSVRFSALPGTASKALEPEGVPLGKGAGARLACKLHHTCQLQLEVMPQILSWAENCLQIARISQVRQTWDWHLTSRQHCQVVMWRAYCDVYSTHCSAGNVWFCKGTHIHCGAIKAVPCWRGPFCRCRRISRSPVTCMGFW